MPREHDGTLASCPIHPGWSGLIVATCEQDAPLRFYAGDDATLEAVRQELRDTIFVFIRRKPKGVTLAERVNELYARGLIDYETKHGLLKIEARLRKS